jgi:ATP-dependent RNA helicase DeaD
VHDHGREMVWFRVDIGRERNADPRWLLPLLCRAGDVTKAEVGAIRIFDRDTRFQIAAEFADKFAQAASSMKPNEGRISRVGPSMGEDTAAASNGIAAAPARKDREAKAAPSPDRQADPRAKTPWRDRKNGKAGGQFHRKADEPRRHRKGPRPNADAPKPSGTYKPASKHAHKKKHRSAPDA